MSRDRRGQMKTEERLNIKITFTGEKRRSNSKYCCKIDTTGLESIKEKEIMKKARDKIEIKDLNIND